MFIHLLNLLEYPCENFNYLDVQVIVRESKLITDIYVKQTESHQ